MTRFKIISVLLVVAISAFVVTSLFQGIAGTARASSLGRVLTYAELDAVFGDGTSPCVQTVQCSSILNYGTGQCSYCDSSSSRGICCSLGDEASKCDYGTTSVCEDSELYVGTARPAGSTSCNTCTSPNITEQAKKCTTLKDTEDSSTNCPGT